MTPTDLYTWITTRRPDRRDLDWVASSYLDALERGDLPALRAIRLYATGDREMIAALRLVHADLALERCKSMREK